MPTTAGRAIRTPTSCRTTIVDRFCLLGPASAHVERLRELADLGVDQFALYLMHDQARQTLDAYGSEIIPALS